MWVRGRSPACGTAGSECAPSQTKLLTTKAFILKITTRLVCSGAGKGGKGRVKVTLEAMKITISRDDAPSGRVGSRKPAKNKQGLGFQRSQREPGSRNLRPARGMAASGQLTFPRHQNVPDGLILLLALYNWPLVSPSQTPYEAATTGIIPILQMRKMRKEVK